MSEDNSNQKNIEDRLVELEAKLLEQEHRPWHLFKNYKSKNKYKENDLRRKSINKATFYNILFFLIKTSVIISPLIVSGYSLYFMFRQTELFESQNNLFESQNGLFNSQNLNLEKQTQLIEASRRSSYMFIMGEVLSDINRELEDKSNKNKTLSDGLVARIITLSRAMKPYRYLENDTLIKSPISPERGQLLITLHESNINKEFLSERIISKSDFSYADLSNSNLNNCIFNNINLTHANLFRATLINSQMINSKFTNANLEYVNFRDSNLSKSNFAKARMERTNFENANLKNSRFTIDDFLSNNNYSKKIIVSEKTNLDNTTLCYETPWRKGTTDSIYKVWGNKKLKLSKSIYKKLFKNYSDENVHSYGDDINGIHYYSIKLKK